MNYQCQKNKAEYIAQCLELAILYEVSGYPKPGNVHRTADFVGTRFEHFLASAVAVSPSFRFAAEQGIKFSEGELLATEIGIGNIIRDAANRMIKSQTGGNTLLGSIIILTPIAIAAGILQSNFIVSKIREKIRTIVESTTPEDAVALYDAIAS